MVALNLWTIGGTNHLARQCRGVETRRQLAFQCRGGYRGCSIFNLGEIVATDTTDAIIVSLIDEIGGRNVRVGVRQPMVLGAACN